ncbi:MAG: GntR family transcriptional regulator [Eubacteriales bacterium]|nr:GntR family transcriptional regulator [Eubacteriales bacterium]
MVQVSEKRKKKISRISVVDQVCAAIKQDIVDGVWKAGDKLPSETELSEMFGVNRLSVRMALQKLITLGFIETRVGEGSYVKHFSLMPILQEIAVVYEGEEKYAEVRALRYLLETECTKLAVMHSTKSEQQELLEALNRYRHCTAAYGEHLEDEKYLDELVDADFAFHYKVVKMSHNTLYKDIYFMVQQLIRGHIAELVSTRMKKRRDQGLSPTLSDNLDTHARIYEAVVAHDFSQVEEDVAEMVQIKPIKGMDMFD